LLVRLRADADPTGWCEFVQLYEPLLSTCARRAGILEQDVPDVVQDILVRLLRVLPGFEYTPERGRFRAWLGAVCRTSIADWRRRQRRGLNQTLPLDVVSRAIPNEPQWDIEHRRYVLRHALATVCRQVSASAWTCFEQYVLHERSATVVAAELQLTPAAVYVIASRVRARVRHKCAQFDEELA
jgi:RNA polymerase sigma-70 factor (ECF subfamily)